MNIIHIGYPKTATTFLQNQVFPNMEGVNYVDYRTCVRLFEDVIYMDDLDYDYKLVQDQLAAYLTGEINLFSLESLTGAPFTFKGLNRSVIPHRLKDLRFDKVIITIRNQTDVIDSLYRQYVYQGGVMKFDDFLNLDQKWNAYIQAFNLSYLKYDRLVQKYREVFGEKKVMILPQELLRSDKDQFYSDLERFIGSKLNLDLQTKRSNESVSNLSTNLIRILNHFTFNSQKPNQLINNHISTKLIKKGFQVIADPFFFSLFSKKRNMLSERQASELSRYYHQSNINLNEILDQDLEKMGYL